MSERLETKNLFIEFMNTIYSYSVTPIKDSESNKVIYEVNFTNALSTMSYSSGLGWHQLSGTSIYTDILILMGINIERNYSNLF